MSTDEPPEPTLDDLLGSVRRDLRQGALGRALSCGPYTLIQVLGEGGVAQVFAASKGGADSGPTHAVKLMRPGLDSEDVLARFERERALLARLHHPGIVTACDAGMHPSGSPWFAMPLVHGPAITVAADLARLGIGERLDLFRQVVAAIAAAHGAGIIHRDLKPANILVEPVERRLHARVIDFGLARAVCDAGRLTPSGAAHRMGTPDYMAPEQWEGGLAVCDARADVFALGIVLGELMCGCVPRLMPADGERSSASNGPHTRRAPTAPIPPSAALDALSRQDAVRVDDIAKRRATSQRALRKALLGLDPLVARLTANDPADRPADASAVLALL